MSEFDRWLESAGLHQYAALLAEHRVDFDVLPDLTDEDLRGLGLPLGDRKRLLRAAASVRAAPATEAPASAVAVVPTAPQTTLEVDVEALATRAERRQVTIVFCDLVDSTALAGRLDPEELADVMKGYQTRCETVVAKWDGHLAEFLGDGAVVYFGWPLAHEDDAERAVHAALELTRAASELMAGGQPLAARAGIATGLVVVGDIKSDSHHRREGVVGSTPNLAARVQGLAPPGGVAITVQTRTLIGESFALTPVAPQALKGITGLVASWLVTGVLGGRSRFDVRAGANMRRMVGREAELAQLLGDWEAALGGSGRAVLITGEAGIGKSRLLQSLVERTSGSEREHVAFQCSPFHRHTSLMPFIEWLKRSAGIQVLTDAPAALAGIETFLTRRGYDRLDDSVPLIAALLSVPFESRYAAPLLSAQLQRERTIDLIVELIRGPAASRPVLMVLEDLHWADPTTLELLTRLTGASASFPGLIVMTARPGFDSPFAEQAITRITLDRLAATSTNEIVTDLTGGRRLPDSVLQSVVATAGGVPLFVEELTKSLLESGRLREVGDTYELVSQTVDLMIPATLHDLLVSRLDSLGTGKVVVRVAATVGLRFGRTMLERVVPSLAGRLRDDLRQLCDAGILETTAGDGSDDEGFAFRHALVREAAYQSQLKSRRRQVHLDVAQVLELHYPNVVAAEPEVLAHHHAEGGQAERAAEYLLVAGHKSTRGSALREAVTHLSRGLELVRTSPHSLQRDRLELRLQAALGTTYMQARGWAAPEVESAYLAAATLSEAAETTAEEIRVLWGTWVYYQVRGRLDDAVAAAAQIQARADRSQSDESLLVADMIGLQVHLYAGNVRESLRRCARFRARYDAARYRSLTDLYSTDLELVCVVHEAIGLWITGDTHGAIETAQQARALAEAGQHPYSIAWSNTWGSVADLLAGNSAALRPAVATGAMIARQHGYAYVEAMASTLQGWITGEMGDPDAGAKQMRAGLAAFRATGAEIACPFFVTLEAELLVRAGQYADALVAIRRALTQIDLWGERWSEAEAYRLQGNALVAMHDACTPEAETSYRRAVAIAEQQGARGWQLRAARDFAAALQRSGRGDEGRALLAPLVASFAMEPATEDVSRAQDVLAGLTTTH